ncbi:MAG: TonB-dependent receptor [Candidatus Eisenbacteria bacterium]|nr:TonB-dependent receptor [Candidatus Eisenbacteria bacterium]
MRLLAVILRVLFVAAPFLVLLLLAASFARAEASSPIDLTMLSLEDLMAIEVTSVSKKTEHLSDAAAAVYVLTGEEIRRTGATTIADALRFVPGLQVARVSSSWWAITSRGFAGNFSNKLLVLIDGRSVYTPFYAGVYWDAQDVLLEDVERIEVIRGPGAALWGANAMNGVINIITKEAAKTQGYFSKTAAGSQEKRLVEQRYGASIGENARLRIYAKYADRDGFPPAAGSDANDGWSSIQGGFRLDGEAGRSRHFTVQGDAGEGEVEGAYSFPIVQEPYYAEIEDTTRFRGGNVLLRWTETLSDLSELSVQAYFDRSDRDNIRFSEEHNTIDLDLHHRWRPIERAEIVWGAGYRTISDRVDSVQGGYTVPAERTVGIASGFVQTDLALRADELYLTLGSKFERNEYTGLEIQPNARLRWLPSENHTLWGAVSRAARTPSRVERDAVIEWETIPPYSSDNRSPYPAIATLYGTDDFRSEKLTAYEVGYRFHPGDRMMIDLTTFYNRYTCLRTGEIGAVRFQGSPVSWIVLPVYGTNLGEGQTYGAEAAIDWRAANRLWFRTGYGYLRLDVWTDESGEVIEVEAAEGASPEHQAFTQAFVDLPGPVQADIGARYVDRLDRFDLGSHLTLDARIGWQPDAHVELFLVGTNLVGPKQVEFVPELRNGRFAVERAVYGGASIRY